MALEGIKFGQVSRFLVSFGVSAGLQDVRWEDVNRFRVERDLGKLRRKKMKLKGTIAENLTAISGYMSRKGNNLGEVETAVVRSLWVQHKSALESVEKNIGLVDELMSWRALEAKRNADRQLGVQMEGQDELPF